jgi:hypothetical protein
MTSDRTLGSCPRSKPSSRSRVEFDCRRLSILLAALNNVCLQAMMMSAALTSLDQPRIGGPRTPGLFSQTARLHQVVPGNLHGCPIDGIQFPINDTVHAFYPELLHDRSGISSEVVHD